MATEGERLRSWGGAFALGLAFPVAALVAAGLVFATAPISVGLGVSLVAALIPWALVAGDVRVGPWAMAGAGVGIPGVIVAVHQAPGAIFLALLAVAWLAASGESRAAEITAALVAVVVLPVVIPVVEGDWGEESHAFVFFATGSLITWFFGRVLRRERRLVAALRAAQERLEAAAAAEERQRIARDIHDVVGHSLTVMLLNVGGARRVLSQDPAAAAEALERAEGVGRDSLQSVRSIVGLLRVPGEAGAEAPRPGAGDIAELVQTAAAAGLSVHIEAEGEIDAVDPYAGLAAYRLVQEAISNVEHHAPASQVVVRLVREGDHLSVVVRNGPTGRTPSSPPAGAGRRAGTGLDGMRQRLAAVGGTVTAGPDGDGWLVEGSIPLRRAGAEAGR